MTSFADPNDDELAAQDAMFHPKFPQIRAMFYRKLIGIKRSLGNVIANIIVTLIVSCLSIIVKVLMDTQVKNVFKDYNFNAYDDPSNYIVIVADDYDNKYFQRRYVQVIEYLFKKDTGRDPIIKLFQNSTAANTWLYDCKMPGAETEYVTMGIILPTEFNTSGGNNLTMMWNDTVGITMQTALSAQNQSLIDLAIIYRIELAMLTFYPELNSSEWWDMYFGTGWESIDGISTAVAAMYQMGGFTEPSNAEVIWSLLTGQGKDIVFSMIAPLLIAAGITSVISTMIPGPIHDIQGPIRSYMVSCSLEIFPYWFVTFVIDLIIWLIDVTLVWILFIVCSIKCFSENLGPSYYILAMTGPCFVLYIYVLSFIFTNPESAARNAFIVNVILLIIPVIVTLVTVDWNNPLTSLQNVSWANWIYGLFPPLLMEGYMQNVFIYYQYNTEGMKYYFKTESTAHQYSYYIFIDIVLYAVILIIIEHWRLRVQRRNAKSNFGDYGEFFREQKAKHPVTQEAEAMANEVEHSHDYAVRIENVSRLFFNTEGKPIPAVNCVSLGVKKGSLFGFLGANGAGKTTLINMITSMLPPSDGHIEINGVDIMQENDPTLLSVCPQFNDHLCPDLTISEHFHFYSLLHRMSPEHERRNSERLLRLLDLTSFKDIPIRELSEGDVRKLAIALSFLGKAKIILLDEPTATLDPVSRRQVHEMILYYKGQKTFMLCTHLLSEAEALCDMISIMIKGNVYTCGSPQYLSSKFGTDFKIDMMLNDETEETGRKVDKFFEEKLPQAQISIKRPSARIYNVPASSIRLGQLFNIMEKGKDGDNGFNYFTCSSSSLEKVFMEIVRISEGGEPDAAIM